MGQHPSAAAAYTLFRKDLPKKVVHKILKSNVFLESSVSYGAEVLLPSQRGVSTILSMTTVHPDLSRISETWYNFGCHGKQHVTRRESRICKHRCVIQCLQNPP